MKMLIIEDEKLTLESLVKYFKAKGFDVAYADTVEEGLSMTEKSNPDIMLVDLKLNYKDAMPIVRQACKNNPKPEIIVITGFVDPEVSKELRSLDVKYTLIKPIELPKLAVTVEAAAKKLKR